MNTYRTEFFAKCPTNGVRIKYVWTIKASHAIKVEAILAAAESVRDGFHEDIADSLAMPDTHQTLVAEHHGVTIETERP